MIRLLPAADGISSVALTAYRRAATLANAADSVCDIPWQLVAAIGYIESDHGQIGGDSLDAQGNEAAPIEGLVLDGGGGVARIVDASGHYVRAEGPLQFIPSTWASWRVDANGDGHADPQNIFDASAAAARYLCSSGGSLATVPAQGPAITSYNASAIYVTNVENVERAYLAGRSADTVTLIPMPVPCPSPSPTPTPSPGSQPTAAPSASPTPANAAAPPVCPGVRPKQVAQHRKPTTVTGVIVRQPPPPAPATVPPATTPAVVTPSPHPSTSTPTPTPTPPPTPVLTPSATSTP
ncbi:MAG: hypothetical protein NVSMB48_19420 [Marmoricola sp.]